MADNYQIIKGGKLIYGLDKEPLNNAYVVIKNDKIVETGRKEEVNLPSGENVKIYDAKNKTIMPGLIDTHTHLQLVPEENELDVLQKTIPYKTLQTRFNAVSTLKAGFTTIRDLGAENLVDLAVRDAINDDLSLGPRILASGYKVIPTGADFQIYPPRVSIDGRKTMDSPAEIRKHVRKLVAMGVDQIKVMTSGRTFRKSSSPDAQTFSLEEMKTAVDEAHNHDKKVSAHAHGSKGVKLALEAGCDTIEHGTELDCEDIEFMIENNIFLIPTFSYGKKVEKLKKKSGLPNYIIEKTLKSRKKRLDSFRRAIEAGVKVAMGSDSGMPFVYHGTNAFELTEFIKAGMNSFEAIITATSNAAAALGIEEKTGTIEKGKLADIIVVKGDPLDDINVLTERENIKFVFKEGEIVFNNV